MRMLVFFVACRSPSVGAASYDAGRGGATAVAGDLGGGAQGRRYGLAGPAQVRPKPAEKTWAEWLYVLFAPPLQVRKS